jgi:hypothetical protein
MDRISKETISVVIDGERISHEVYVDDETKLDIDPNTGVFRTRSESEELIREVYNIGKVSMKGELERYNKWIRSGNGRRHHNDMFRKIDSKVAVRDATADSPKSNGSSVEENVERAEAMKNRGNELLGRGDTRKALQQYLSAVSLLEHSQKKDTHSNSLLAVCFSNAAEACLRLQRLEDALGYASASIAADLTKEKSHFRKCVSLQRLGRLAECREALAKLQERRALCAADWESVKKAAEVPGTLRVCPKSQKFITSTDARVGDVLLELPVIALPAAVEGEDDARMLCRWFLSVDGKEASDAVVSFVALCGGPPLMNVHPDVCCMMQMVMGAAEHVSHERACSAMIFLLCAGKLSGNACSDEAVRLWSEGLMESDNGDEDRGLRQRKLVLGRARLTRVDGNNRQNASLVSHSDRCWTVVSTASLPRGTMVVTQ